MERDKAARRCREAALMLPSRLRGAVLSMPTEKQAAAEELRLRSGFPMTVLLPGGEEVPEGGEEAVAPEEIETLVDLATDFSRYAASETIRAGFLPVRGGFRVGLCGTMVMKDGVSTHLKDVSSAVIRIGRERKDAGETAAPALFREGEFVSTLLLSPPGGGKTTLLRDLVRRLSDGVGENGHRRICLIDERGEVAVMYRGLAQMDVGRHTDVLDGCPKALGIPIVLRAMNPQIIAVDEIATLQDVEAIRMAVGCGVRLLGTIHAGSVEELRERPFCRALLEAGAFSLAVQILPAGDGLRRYEVKAL